MRSVNCIPVVWMNVSNMLNDGLAQSDRIIIRECNLTDNYMKQRIQGKIQNGFPIITLWTFNGEEIRLLYNTEG